MKALLSYFPAQICDQNRSTAFLRSPRSPVSKLDATTAINNFQNRVLDLQKTDNTILAMVFNIYRVSSTEVEVILSPPLLIPTNR